MQLLSIGMNKEKESLYRWAYALAVITISYNLLEGLVSIYFGIEDFNSCPLQSQSPRPSNHTIYRLSGR